MMTSSIIDTQLRYQFVDHHSITTPAELHCNSLNNKEIIGGRGGGLSAVQEILFFLNVIFQILARF